MAHLAREAHDRTAVCWDTAGIGKRGSHVARGVQRSFSGKDGWGALEQFLDFTQEEWRAAAKRATRRLAQVLFENREQVDLPVDMGPVDIAMDMGLQDLPMDMGPVAVPVALEPMEAEQD